MSIIITVLLFPEITLPHNHQSECWGNVDLARRAAYVSETSPQAGTPLLHEGIPLGDAYPAKTPTWQCSTLPKRPQLLPRDSHGLWLFLTKPVSSNINTPVGLAIVSATS